MHELSGPTPGSAEPAASEELTNGQPEPLPREKEWIFFPGGDDGTKSPVIKEIDKEKLSRAEAARLQDVMDRVIAGEAMPKDVKDLGGGILEFKLHLDRRSYRMVFAEVDEGFVFLALTFFRKTQQRQPNDLERARKRLKKYLKDTSTPE